ncbi:MAG: SDR family oxidoreductase [Gemmatimonadetes bacterium]|nr:MAG: SDR family oxidoreductase [Gemmatimonadota bacterium]
MRKMLIIGATSDIAQATVRLWAKAGDSLVLVARNPEKLNILQADLKARGAPVVETITADLNDFDRHEAIIQTAITKLGELDGVLVAHGILPDQKQCENDYSACEAVFRTNFLSVVSLLTPLANYFEAKRQGVIAVISSVAGDRGRRVNYIYGASKGGLNTYLEGLRYRLAPAGVTVLTIKPGFVDTAMTAHRKPKGFLFAAPETVAKDIDRAIRTKKGTLYTPWFWWWILLVVRHTPEFILKKINV